MKNKGGFGQNLQKFIGDSAPQNTPLIFRKIGACGHEVINKFRWISQGFTLLKFLRYRKYQAIFFSKSMSEA